MARNYEKNFGRLNRLWLEKETGKKVKRPKLSSLKSAAEISRWLPDLKREIDFCLKQSEVPCYTDKKVADYHKHIVHLEREYKSFLRKLHQLDSSVTVAPWTPRPYERRKQSVNVLPILHPVDGEEKCTVLNSLHTPVLVLDSLYEIAEHCGGDISNSVDSTCVNNAVAPVKNTSLETGLSEQHGVKPLSAPVNEERRSELQEHNHNINPVLENNLLLSPHIYKTENIERKPNLLGLCYSSSDED